MRITGYALVLLVATTLLTLSCGPAQQRYNPVQGKVLYQGKPLASALVAFHPQGDSIQERSVGRTDEEGAFHLMTGEVLGAPTGKYSVTIICPMPVDRPSQGMAFGGPSETEDRLKGAYAAANKSQLFVEVTEGTNAIPPFELK